MIRTWGIYSAGKRLEAIIVRCRNSSFSHSGPKRLICTVLLYVVVCSIAACFISYLFDRPIETPPVCVLNGGMYELITDRKSLGKLGLKQMASKNDVGDHIGVCHFDDGTTAEAYDYSHQDGTAIAVVPIENAYYFLAYCNPTIKADNELPGFSELFEIYGLQADKVTIVVDGKDESHNDFYVNLLRKLMSTVGVRFDMLQYEIQMYDRNNLKWEEIVVLGGNTRNFKMRYYPGLQYVETHSLYFKV